MEEGEGVLLQVEEVEGEVLPSLEEEEEGQVEEVVVVPLEPVAEPPGCVFCIQA